jgi:hypothetical protein
MAHALTITPPEHADIQELAQQLLLAKQVVLDATGAKLSDSEDDLELLQAVIDAGVLHPDQTYEWQSLGLVFGRVLVATYPGFDWVVVEDEHGRDPALRYEQTSILVFPLTMISKRIEDGETVSVRALFDGLLEHLDELTEELGWQGKPN